jgi:phosphate transport system substrate-binding protein
MTPNTASDDAYLNRATKGNQMVIIAILVVLILILAVVAGAYAAGWIGGKTTTNTVTVYHNNTVYKNNTTKQNNTKNNTAPPWLPACGGPLTAGGSTLVYPLMAVWTSTYAGVKCNTTMSGGATSTEVNYNAVGSGSGITDLTDGLYVFGASDAPLTVTQNKSLPSPVVTFPDAAGTVTIAYNLKPTNSTGVVTPLHFTGPVLAEIYNGSITKWNDSRIQAINPGLTIPGTAITVEHRSDGSGTSFAFTTFLSAESTWWKTNVGASTSPAWPTGLGQKGSEGIAGAVASTSGAIGYVELNYAEEEGANVQLGEIQNPAGNYVFPSVTTTSYAVDNATNLPANDNFTGYAIINGVGTNTYPIATLTYIMVYKDIGSTPAYKGEYTQNQAAALVQFLWWIVHTGQNDSVGLFYVPLPSVVVSFDATEIGNILYNGATLTSHAPPAKA